MPGHLFCWYLHRNGSRTHSQGESKESVDSFKNKVLHSRSSPLPCNSNEVMALLAASSKSYVSHSITSSESPNTKAILMMMASQVTELRVGEFSRFEKDFSKVSFASVRSSLMSNQVVKASLEMPQFLE